jgi:uncharacterized protein with HEPN domain
MSSKRPDAALLDIRHHIALISQFVADFDYSAFEADVRTVYAVIRCLEIISEASRHLPDELKMRHANIAWKNMAGAGNVYRHDYEEVATRFVWVTIQRDLPSLSIAIEDELTRLGR